MKTRAILSVLGEDRTGIVAAVSAALETDGVNIEDTRQTIVGGIFSMTMLVTVDEDETPIDRVRSSLDEVAGRLDVQISLQPEDVFRAKHAI
jgi:ACT domain-containing protein